MRFPPVLQPRRPRRVLAWLLLVAAAFLPPAWAGEEDTKTVVIDQSRGVDQRVDYAALTDHGPWDDRNYQLRKEDLAVLPKDDRYLPTVPAFFKVIKRREMIAQGFPLIDIYPREIDKEFQYRHGGLLQNGELKLTERGRHHYIGPENPNPASPGLLATDPIARNPAPAPWAAPVLSEGPFDGTLSNNETTIEFHPTNPNIAIAGSNGSGGQRMSFSSDGGVTWGNSGALAGTCCDPAIEFTSNGAIAFAATLGQSASGCGFSLCSTVYWSFNNGQTWLGPVHTSTASSDKEWIHVDKSPGSPYRDRVYLTWHQGNVMQFARSTALPVSGGSGLTFAPTIAFSADERGIGSDIATDRQGRVYYVYPSVTTGSAEMYVLRSDDGGQTFVDLDPARAGLGKVIYDLHGRFDFAIPAMESRRVFIYAVVDVDLSGGPRDGRIYVAFTDENPGAGSPGNGTGTAAASHGWIRVIYSDDQGQTWSGGSTPHPLADQVTVDRFQPWMKVDGFGNVHVGWQDTRNSGAGLRDKADWYYAVSTDGGNTWREETRVSSVVSQNIANGQEWGDYNGLALSSDGQTVGMTWTDNRIVTPPSTTSQRSFAGRVGNLFAGPSYAVALPGASLSLCAGAPVPPIDVTLSAINGFTGQVALSTPGRDAAVFPTANFTPNPVSPTVSGVASTLQLTTAAGATTGGYTVSVQGADGSTPAIVRGGTLQIDVSGGPVAAPALTTPAAGATNVATGTSFTWSPSANAIDYLVEIATDAAFSNIVVSSVTRQTTFTPTQPLNSATPYFWRVTARNACPPVEVMFASGFELSGAGGTATASGSFTTQPAPGDCPTGGTVTDVLSEGFEGAATGWVQQAGGTGANTWAIGTTFPFAGLRALRGIPAATVSDQRFVSPTVTLPSVGNGLTLSFMSRQEMERRTAGGCWDGGFIEVSTNGGTTWTQITSGLLTDPYDGALASPNPAAPAPAWCGDPQAYLKSVIDLAPYAGQTVQFRFRATSDDTVNRPGGWAIDDVLIRRCN
ncbi:MAG: choice-of-anchor J domain-containing protein [Pseudomonadota bacterium]